ncbi:cyclic AMP-responsive element-binding protein 1 [Nilaparvata lugens]|uniref:cyclic AMP-responsive element-binding protein 1 n=1 Tax=Nilaparvata lugens TaxID=108931 RepID=UPI00193E5F56|nr:cyclic AMP-responsive element-binding protein 1 [Nilaparvata lugens]
MDGIVEENGCQSPGGGAGGRGDLGGPNSPQSQPHPIAITAVQSVIQANQSNQQSVIQSAGGNVQQVLTKGNVILVKQPNSALFDFQVVEAGSDDSLSNDEDTTKKRRDLLTRRPSYRKILNELGGGEIAGGGVVSKVETDDSDDSNLDSELSSHSLTAQYQTVIPAGTIQLSQGEGVGGLHTLTMTNATTAGGGTIVQYTQAQDGQFFVPGEIVVTQGSGSLSGGSPIIAEDQQRKRELRLLKNREAARECRRKKKEYIKCLENRVAVLENQNKALIDELKSLKELYCQQKTD